ncbi:hypothetical protein GGS24DRAFT_265063 [Hypoxylon argillaceum]|nr:hypothetical protein GGS24DRAFT_265063 [Hypoxylon argillaceum]
MAMCHRAIGQLEMAASCHRLAVEGRTLALGHNHPDTLWSINDRGKVLTKQGKYSEALALQLKALALQSTVLGPKHEHTAWTRKEVDELRLLEVKKDETLN